MVYFSLWAYLVSFAGGSGTWLGFPRTHTDVNNHNVLFLPCPGSCLSHDVSCGQSESVLNMPRVLAVVVDVMIAIEAGITIVVIVEVDVVGTTG